MKNFPKLRTHLGGVMDQVQEFYKSRWAKENGQKLSEICQENFQSIKCTRGREN